MKLSSGEYSLRPYDCIVWISVLLVASSFVAELQDFPDSPFSHKQNFLNRIVVGFGWGIVLAFVSVQSLVTTRIIGCDDWPRKLKGTAIRLAVNSTLWYVLTAAMTFVRNKTGYCISISNNNLTEQNITTDMSYKECMIGGGEWSGFDASGHVFLMALNMLVMVEEAAVFRIARILRNAVARDNLHIQLIRQRYTKCSTVLCILIVGNYVLLALWTWTMLTTCFYFHTFLEKVIGFFLAILAWRLAYKNFQHFACSPGFAEAEPTVLKYIPKEIVGIKSAGAASTSEAETGTSRVLLLVGSGLSLLMTMVILQLTIILKKVPT
ncbi:acyl-coenzyme A diphosphatase FITM2-like [Sycon ciliatum]|uniref:acyl-coenzyme A diphosphatase FITM2-like n=1 Tax=Sycon ciliatum TaxID=27933 RepID=UPI0031F61478